MSFDINTNIASLQAQNYLRINGDFQSKTIQRVTSGLRIVTAGDDAAGLAIANTERSDGAVLSQGIRNANDGLSTLQTIDGGISNISGLLDRARTLATQSATGTMADSDRATLNNEFQNVLSEINRQAQAIGMTAGGQYAKAMSIFLGGGQNDTAHSGAAAKITNGTVSVDFSKSLLDTTSLGLSGNGVQGAVITAGSNAVSQAITDRATLKFTLAGPGFDMTTVDVSATFTAANVKTESDAVNVINDAINLAAQSNTALATANIHASFDSASGKLVLTGSTGFSVLQAGQGAQDLLGASLMSAGSSSSTQAWRGTLTAAETLTFSWNDAAGTFHSHNVSLASTVTQAQAATTISNDASNGGIFAVVSGGNLVFIKGDGGAFTVTAATAGAKGVAAGTYGSASTQLGTSTALDISSSSTASTAVTALSSAVANLGTVQGTVGRAENQLGYAINLAQSQLTNLSAAESRIRDADLASEAANLTKAQILMQAGTAALAQANAAPQVVLSLLSSKV